MESILNRLMVLMSGNRVFNFSVLLMRSERCVESSIQTSTLVNINGEERGWTIVLLVTKQI